MKDVFWVMNRILEKEKNLILARIIGHRGSTPRTTGTRCLILEDGSIMGTIGGGRMEYLAIQKAKTVSRDRRSTLLKLALYGKEAVGTEMLCGGTADLYLEPLSISNSETQNLFSHVDRMLREGQRGVLVSRISEGLPADTSGCRVLMRADFSILGMIPGLTPEKIRTFLTMDTPQRIETGIGAIFVEPIIPQETLYLFGAGHVSFALCPLADAVGFRVVVIDDRAEFANPQRFPEADAVHVAAFSGAFQEFGIPSDSYIAVLTRGHIHDLTVLRDALKARPRYVGMIGSRRKRDTLYAALIQEGVDAETLARVCCPIGLEIHARTPEEIAVSIVAELIAVRNSGSAAVTPLKNAGKQESR